MLLNEKLNICPQSCAAILMPPQQRCRGNGKHVCNLTVHVTQSRLLIVSEFDRFQDFARLQALFVLPSSGRG